MAVFVQTDLRVTGERVWCVVSEFECRLPSLLRDPAQLSDLPGLQFLCL